jgi:hypothetical protein
MSSAAVEWALGLDLNAPRKVLLIALAWISDDDGATIKAQKTIAERLGKDARWVREHLPKLAEEGYVSRFRRHRLNGSRTTDLIVLNMPRITPFDPSIYDGIVGDLEPGDRTPSGGNPPGGLAADSRQASGGNPPPLNQPRNQPPIEQEERAGERASGSGKKTEDMDAVPADFPVEMLPHLRGVVRVLRQVAADQQGARAVSAKAVARVIEPRPRKPLVKAAHDLAAWAADRRDLRDVVATYRNWLDNPRTPTLAALERVTDRGHLDHEAPSSGSTGGAGGGNASKASRRAASMEESRRLAEELRSQGL